MQPKHLAVLALTLGLATACGQTAKSLATSPSARGFAARAVSEPAVTTMISPHRDSRDGAKVSAIVLHHTAMVEEAVETGKFFQKPTAKVSAHYVVGRDGTIVRSVADAERAWHAGRSQFGGVGDVNDFSIGIEICNVGDGKEPYPKAQMDAIVKLVAWLGQTHGIDLATRVTRHRDVAIPAGRKTDTSDNFDHAYVKTAAQALLAGRTAPRYAPGVAPSGYDRTQQTRVVAAGDTWASIADDVYDAESLAPAVEALNPGVALRAGVTVKLPTRYR